MSLSTESLTIVTQETVRIGKTYCDRCGGQITESCGKITSPKLAHGLSMQYDVCVRCFDTVMKAGMKRKHWKPDLVSISKKILEETKEAQP